MIARIAYEPLTEKIVNFHSTDIVFYQEAVCYPASMDGTPPRGVLQPIYPMERPPAISDPFSMADSVENRRLGRNQTRKPASSPAQTMQISERCAQEPQSYPPPHGQNALQSRK